MRVFLDTNVWISGLASAGLCKELLTQSLKAGVVLSSLLVREEVTAVITRKFEARSETLSLFLDLWQYAECVADAPDDLGDNDARLVAAASAAGADLFVTGDKAVLAMGRVASMRIEAPRTAWIMLFNPEVPH